MYPKGEALCPRCGSSYLTYKNVYRYFKCNKCENTFITPVYSYGQEQASQGFKTIKDLTNQLFGESQLERQEEEKASNVNVRRRRKASNIGWLITLIITCILVITAVTLWAFYSDLIKELLSRLVESIS